MKAPNLAEYRAAATDVMCGRSLTFVTDQGEVLAIGFTMNGLARWQSQGFEWSGQGNDRCEVVEIADGTFFIDIDVETPPLDALTVLVAPWRGYGLIVHQRRCPGSNPAVSHQFYIGRLQGCTSVGLAPAPTSALLGRWHRLRYSPENLYEHIYISERKMCSHNLDTENTPGRVECHEASYWKFDKNIFLISWRERDSQAGMILCENLSTLRAVGKVLHPISDERSASAPMGGFIYPAKITFPAEVSANFSVLER